MMEIQVGCAFTYESSTPSPAVVLVRPGMDAGHQIADESWSLNPPSTHQTYRDLLGNRIDRLVLPVGTAEIRYDARVVIDGELDVVKPTAVQQPVEALPDDTLLYTLSSRYCPTEALMDVAWHWFGDTAPGWSRVQEICDWVHTHIRYGVPSSPLTTASDVYLSGGGMCRDFAHLAITFCRALAIPARYVFGYLPDIGVTGPQPPMDFHAWFEAYLDDRWWTFDARFNRPRIGRIPIGYGRDAVDVAMVTTFGSAAFQKMTVWSDPLSAESLAHATKSSASENAGRSEGLVRIAAPAYRATGGVQ